MLPTFTIEIIWLKKTSYVEDLVTYQRGSLEWEKCRQRKNKRRTRKSTYLNTGLEDMNSNTKK